MRVRGREVTHAAVRGDAADAEEGTLRLWIAAERERAGKIAFANGKGVDTSKDAIAHCAAAIEAFAECATRLGDDPATVANDALVEATDESRASRRRARAKVRMAWRMETLRARLETIEGERAREKTRADVAEARVASFSETVATRESPTRESDRREKKALEEATRRATREASRAATLESRAATLESRVAELERITARLGGARARRRRRALRRRRRALRRRDSPTRVATRYATNEYASRRTSTSGRCATPRRRRGSKKHVTTRRASATF